MKPGNSTILNINGGSSSIKFALYAAVEPLKRGSFVETFFKLGRLEWDEA